VKKTAPPLQENGKIYFLLQSNLDDLSEHDHGISFHNGNTAQTLFCRRRGRMRREKRKEGEEQEGKKKKNKKKKKQQKKILFHLAGLEGVDDEGLKGLKGELSHLVGLDKGGSLLLLASGGLSNLPGNVGHLHGGTSSAHKGNRRVSDLQLTRVSQNLDLSNKGLDGGQAGVGLQDHNVSNAGHVSLGQTLHVHSNVGSRTSLSHLLVVHFDSEDLLQRN
jgi:hypothetical protein